MRNGAANGDKHESARSFLYDLLPFLTYVAVQDAPYWLKYYRQHEYSRFIASKFPADFERVKAPEMIRRAKEISDLRAINSVEHLNNAAR